MTSSYAVFEAAIRVKSTHLIKSGLKKQKKEKIWKYEKCLHKAPSKISFWNGIHSFLRRADARGSADFIYRI